MSTTGENSTAEPQRTVKYLVGKKNKILEVDGHRFYVNKRQKTFSTWTCRLRKSLGWVKVKCHWNIPLISTKSTEIICIFDLFHFITKDARQNVKHHLMDVQSNFWIATITIMVFTLCQNLNQRTHPNQLY